MPTIIDLLNAKKGTQTGQPLQTDGRTVIDRLREKSGMPPGAPQISTPEMRPPEQMEKQMTEEKELPFGAIGWNVDGTANYGAGVEGWWKGITSRIAAPTEEGEEPGAPTQVWRGAVEGIVQLGTLFSQPQLWYYGYLADRRSYEMYADMVNQNMPDLYSDNELGNFLRVTTSLIPGISNLTTMYEKDRIKNGSRILPEGTFEKIQEANRIWNKENVGTAIFDTQVQSEYVRRVLAGENPYKVREEYAKPVQNFIADFILDPLNVFEGMGIANKILGKGFKLADGALTAARFADDAADFEKAARATDFAEDGTKLAKEVIDSASKTLDEKIVQTATKIAQESIEAVSKGISSGLFDLTQNAKQVVLFDKMYGVFGPLLKFSNGDAAKYNDMITAIAMIGSRDAKEVATGMKILQDNKILHLFLSDNAMESARFMNRIKESGAKFDKIAELAKIDKAKYFDEMNKIIKPVMEELYPDLAKIAEAQDEIAKIRKIDKTVELPEKLKKFENLKLSPVQKFMAKRHKELQTAWFGTKIGVKPINEFFSLIYLTSPGFTVRNYLNAAATAFVDLGPASLRELVDFTGGGYKYIEDMFGFVPGSISKQFSIVQDVGEAKGVMKYFDFMRRFAGKGEEYESVAIAAHAGKRFSNVMLREGKFIEKMDTLRKAGFSDQALKFLESRVRKYNGQTALALDDFKKEFVKGTVEHFREPESLFSQELLKSMESWKPSFVDEIRDILKEGTLDDVLKKVDDLVADVESRMRSTLDDIKPADDATESQIIRGLQQTLDLSDDGIDQFAKKVNVRRNLEDAIIGTAKEIVEDYAPLELAMRKITSDVMNFQSKFSTDLRELVTQVSNGTISIKDLANKVATDPMFANMGDYVPVIQKNMKRDVAIDTLWSFYKRRMEDMWVNTAKSQYDELMKAIGTTPLKGNKAAMLENLKMRFSIDFKYLNADKLENGEALINLPYYYYKMARNDLSVYEYGKKLGLFASEIQKGAIEGKRIGYRGTIWSVIKDELARIGIKRQIGDINREDEYRWVMARLNDYAVKRNKMEAMRGAIYNYINPMKERAKVLSAIDPLKRSAKETAELTKLNQKTKFMDGMVRIINKKLQAGKLQDIEEFTGNFVEWFAKNADGADVADIIKKAGDETVELKIDYNNIAKTEVGEVIQESSQKLDNIKGVEKVDDGYDDIWNKNEVIAHFKENFGIEDEQEIINILNQFKHPRESLIRTLETKKISINKNILANDFVQYVDELPDETYNIFKDAMNQMVNESKAIRKKMEPQLNELEKISFANPPGSPGYGKSSLAVYDFREKIDKIVEKAVQKIQDEALAKIKKTGWEYNPADKKFKNIAGVDKNYTITRTISRPKPEVINSAIENYRWEVSAGKEAAEVGGDIIQETIDDVAQTAQKAADDVTEAAVDMDKIDLIPDTADGDIIDEAKMLRNQYVGLKQMFNAIKTTISNTYGKVENVSDLNQNQVRVLEEWGRLNEAKMLDFRTRAMSHMKATRDFALLDYAGGKKNIDLALAYIFPYQFWYSRSYTNWIKRLASDPSIINKYNSYREMIAEQNKDLPEYMQNYIVLGKSIGMEENPLMLNLEASLNPLNGLTGVDFTDKNKIVGTPGTIEYAWTKTLDSIGKYGPSPWSPINMATAAALYGRGEKEAAARWFGRFFPQSAPIKAVGSLFNQNWEFDPFVILFGDESGTDPYEQRRVGRALVAMTEAGKITKEQAYEAAKLKSGPIWQEATIFSTKNRAAGTISAYVLGQGFKIRSSYEAEIDRFYEDYFKMWANSDKFTPDEMSNYQRYIRTKYPFADLVILSGKGSEERDRAYSYSVLSRIAPGQSGDIFSALGVDPALTDKFYQDKGNMQQWNPLDKESFMNAMVQIGTLIAIPSDTTVAEWQQVKTIYKQVDKDLQARFGDDILTKIEAFYGFTYDSPEQKNYMEAHPEIAQAMDYKDFMIAGNKQIAPYYDGLNRLERYYDGEFRRQVALKVDPNYYEYYQIRGMIIDPVEQKAFDRQVGWDAMNKKYYAFKKEWDAMVFKQLDSYDKFFLGEALPTTTQEVVSPSVGQQAIQEILAPAREDERRVTWEQITSAIPMPITLERALQQYVTTDRQFSSSEGAMVTRLLNNVNTMYGLTLDKDELLSLAMDYYQ